MRFPVLGLIIMLSSFNSWSMDINTLEKRINQIGNQKVLGQAGRYLELKELSVELNDYTPPFHKAVIEDLDKGVALHGSQLTILHKIVSSYVSLNYQFLKLAGQTTNKALKILARLDRITSFEKNYLPFYGHKKFRRLVNAEDRSYEVEKKELKRTLVRLIDKENIKDLVSKVKNFKNQVANGRIRNDGDFVSEALNHPAHKLLSQNKVFKKLRKKLFGQTLSDFANNTRRFLIHHISGGFGNGVGAIRWRKGHLLHDKKVLSEIYQKIRPLDIITEKTRFALTDTFIPGHFGHNAIWLGTKEQLIELGMWDHPVIRPHQKDIANGKSIIETDRSGTHLKSLEDFMNVDEFAILRIKDNFINSSRVENIYRVAFLQLGKTYDFNFDVETTDKIVCSELLYQSFGDINWPTEFYVGRTTISPDNVVSLSLFDDSPIELIYYVAGSKSKKTYKDLDNLADDLGFKKEENGQFKKPKEVCIYKTVKRPGPRRRGSRMQNTMTVKKCHTEWEEIIYSPHAPLPDFPL